MRHYLWLLPVLLLAGCGEQTTSETESALPAPPAVVGNAPDTGGTVTENDSAPPLVLETESGAKVILAIEEKHVSEADLEKSRTVALHAAIKESPGLAAAECGIRVDERCTFTAEAGVLAGEMSVNDKENYLWMAWADKSGSEDGEKVTGDFLTLTITLPEDAAAGERYPVTYLDKSPTGREHLWFDGEKDLAPAGGVTWTDGGIIIDE